MRINPLLIAKWIIRLEEWLIQIYRKAKQVYFFQLKQFALPLIIKSGMFKVRKGLSKKDFDEEISKLKKGKIFKRKIVENEVIEIKNFILERDGSLVLSYFARIAVWYYHILLDRILVFQSVG
jgi:hypothetical protein